MIVGTSGGQAVYWQRTTDGSFGSPIVLPGGCGQALGVNTAGRILVAGCKSTTGEPAAVMTPPYSAANMTFLGGLGVKNKAFVATMSPSGQYVAGQAGSAVYWKLY